MTEKANGRAPGKDIATVDRFKRNPSMDAASQRKRLVELLRASAQTTYSLRAKGISHPAARVRELITHGFKIATSLVTAADSDGYLHARVALYTLRAEPNRQKPGGRNA